jgi:hypothetical protein
MKKEFKTVETLVGEGEKLVEVELMLSVQELKTYADYCIKKDIKFNDWVRELAFKSIK